MSPPGTKKRRIGGIYESSVESSRRTGEYTNLRFLYFMVKVIHESSGGQRQAIPQQTVNKPTTNRQQTDDKAWTSRFFAQKPFQFLETEYTNLRGAHFAQSIDQHGANKLSATLGQSRFEASTLENSGFENSGFENSRLENSARFTLRCLKRSQNSRLAPKIQCKKFKVCKFRL